MSKPPVALAAPARSAAIVLGRSQHALAVVPVLPKRLRASGGGAVLTGPWLLRAAVRLPRGHALLARGPGAAAEWLGRVHLEWLRERGIAGATLHAGPQHQHWACFGGRGPGEVLVGGRKITGIAQAWQRSGALLAAGTLLHTPPWSLLCDALQRPLGDALQLAECTTCADECLGRATDARAWARSLRAALVRALHATESRAGATACAPIP